MHMLYLKSKKINIVTVYNKGISFHSKNLVDFNIEDSKGELQNLAVKTMGKLGNGFKSSPPYGPL